MNAAKLELLKKALDVTVDQLTQLRSATSYTESSPEAGSCWITCSDGSWGQWNGMVVSAYYHPTKKHTATTVGKLGEKRSEAAAGQWAISKQTRGLYGNKCFYNHI